MKRQRNSIRLNPESPDPRVVEKAAEIISAGGVVVFPTRCLYGLGTDAFNSRAVAGISALKQRPRNKPILVLIADVRDLKRLVARVPRAAERIMRCFWPGRVTLVFQSSDAVSPQLTGGSGKIGVRFVGHPAAAALIRAARVPISGTSANISAHGGCSRPEELDPEIASGVDLILDAGPLFGGAGSTVVDVTVDPPKVLREGCVTSGEIFNCLGE